MSSGLVARMNGAGGMIIGLAGIGAASGYGSGSGRRPGLKTGSKCQWWASLVGFQVLSNSLRSWSKAVPGGVTDGQFSGLLHFATDRTLSGWTLLFAMGKHTSKEFLHGRKHSRISKCPKTRSKVRSKSGPKQVPTSTPNPENTDIPANTGTDELQNRGPNHPKMMGKSTSKIASGTISTRPHFSKAGISLNSIWRPIFKNPQKRGPIPILARPARRLTSNGIS
jgi:hypothetical protein